MDSNKTYLRVNEIFKSIQGESTYTGLPFVFIRLTGCNLRCTYCDTTYAYEEGTNMSLNEIVDIVENYKCKNVCITGGEPLLHNNVYMLMTRLLNNGHKILAETNGSIDISAMPDEVIRIMDIKCPDSGMNTEMNWKNIEKLRTNDEIKFILSSRKDYEWAKVIIDKHKLEGKCSILLGSAYGRIEQSDLANWILTDNINARLQIQLHKYIWPESERGV